jgi:hypothetical protein
VALCASVPCAAQSEHGTPQPPARADNAIYAELFGNGLLYSVNYEHRLTPRVWGRVGFEMVRTHAALFPLMIEFVTGANRRHFEIGAGVIAGVVSSTDRTLGRHFEAGALATATVGYRYQSPEGGFIFRANFTPFAWPEKGTTLLPWFGVSLGHSF